MTWRAVYRIVSAGRGRGKTRLGTGIVSELARRGYRVAVVKHAHGGVDLADKDSHRYMEAGASQVLVSSHGSLAVIYRSMGEELADLLSMVDPRSFIVVVEGFKSSDVGKRIVVAADAGELELLGCSPENTLAVVSDDEGVARAASSMGCRTYSFSQVGGLADLIVRDALAYAQSLLPGLDCARCGFQSCRSFAENVLRGERGLGDCPVLTDFKLLVDGQPVPVNPYVKNVFMSTIQALIGTLKGVNKTPRRVEISFDRGSEARRSSGSRRA